MARRFAGAVLVWALLAASAADVALAAPVKPPAAAAKAPAAAAKAPAAPAAGIPLLPGGGSKEPVNIAADKLDYFDKEQKLIYTGNVEVVQGDSSMKASVLTIFLQKRDAGSPPGGAAALSAAGGAASASPAVAPAATGSSVSHMDAQGPVTLVSKDQVGTGDSATYDKAEDQVTLTGNVTLSQGTNITTGERLIYSMTSGQAQVFSGATAPRVFSVFTPGSGTPGAPADAGKSGPKKDKTVPAKKPVAGAKPAATALQ